MKSPRIPLKVLHLHARSFVLWPRTLEKISEARKDLEKEYPDAKDSEIFVEYTFDTDCCDLVFRRVIDNPNYQTELKEYNRLQAKYEAFQREVAELSKRYQ